MASAADTTLASPIVTTEDGRVTQFTLDHHRAKAIDALTAAAETIDPAAHVGSGPVTVVTAATLTGIFGTYTVIRAQRGRIVTGNAYGRPGHAMLVPKGARSRARDLTHYKILAISKGYLTDDAIDNPYEAQVTAAAAAFEAAEAATWAVLVALPDRDAGDGEDLPESIGAVLTGTMNFMGDRIAGATWFLTDYDRKGDVANGYLVVPGNDAGAVSEHGSIYGSRLFGQGFAPVPFPSGLTFRDVVNVAMATNDDGDAMLARLLSDAVSV